MTEAQSFDGNTELGNTELRERGAGLTHIIGSASRADSEVSTRRALNACVRSEEDAVVSAAGSAVMFDSTKLL